MLFTCQKCGSCLPQAGRGKRCAGKGHFSHRKQKARAAIGSCAYRRAFFVRCVSRAASGSTSARRDAHRLRGHLRRSGLCRADGQRLIYGVLPREIVLCARNQADYDGILDTAFESAGIPYAFDKAVDLSTTPTAALVFSAFDIYFSWSLEAVSAYIKSGLSGLCDEVADKLDLYLHTWNIHGKAYFHEEWHMNPAGMRAEAADTALLALLSDAHDGLLSCLDAFSVSLDAAKTASDMAHTVYELTVNIARLSGKDRFDDRADGEYLDLLCRALDTVALTLAEQTVTPRRFYELLRAVIKNMSIGKIPELLDQVRFSPVTLMRTDGIRYVILLGVNDGIFPAKPESSDVFRDAERKMLRSLGVELAETADDKAFDNPQK